MGLMDETILKNKCPTSLANGEIQAKSILNFHLRSVIMAENNKTANASEDVGEGNTHLLLVSVHFSTATVKINM